MDSMDFQREPPETTNIASNGWLRAKIVMSGILIDYTGKKSLKDDL